MKPRVGPTGDFPEGQLDPDDEGGLDIAISAYRGRIRIDFGKKVAWIAMSPELAKQIATALMNHAVREESNKK